jgi:beta-lactamase regulating signal transducer with metallopeptidase domain
MSGPWQSGEWTVLVCTLLHTLWQGAAAAVLLFLALKTIPVRNVDLRYGLCSAALCFVMTAWLGTWHVLDAHTIHPNASVAAYEPESSERLRMDSGPAPDVPDAHVNVPAVTVFPREGTARTYPLFKRWAGWLAAFWILGVVIGMARMLRGVIGAERLRRQCRAVVDSRILTVMEELQECLGLRNRIRILVNDRIVMPSVMGVIWPAVLLPATFLTGVPADQLRAIIAHELAHIRRYDYLVNLGQMIIEALLFFNPFVWWISQQMRVEREACCDLLAAGHCQSSVRYVEALLSVINHCNANPSPMLAAGGQSKGNALDRASRLLVPGYSPVLRLRWFSLLAVLLLVSATLFGLWKGSQAFAQTIQDQKKSPIEAETASEVILKLGNLFDHVQSFQFTEVVGTFPDDYSKLTWQEMGTAWRIDEIRVAKIPPKDPRQSNNWHTLLSFDGARAYSVEKEDGRVLTEKAPLKRQFTDVDYDAYIRGPLMPFEFLLSKTWPREKLAMFRSADYLQTVAKRAALDPAKDRQLDGHPCVAVKIRDGYNRWNPGHEENVDFVAYLASDLNYYPLAWEEYDKNGKLTYTYTVKQLQSIPLEPHGGPLFYSPASWVWHDATFGFDQQEPDSDIKVNTLGKADFGLYPTLQLYSADGEDAEKIKYIEDVDAKTLKEIKPWLKP